MMKLPCAVLGLAALAACHTMSLHAPDAPNATIARRDVVDTISFETREATRLAFDVSPDGRYIVFDLLGQLWRIPSAGGEATPITNAVSDTAEDFDPAISPDGKLIVFEGDRPGGRALWVMPFSGGAPRRVTSRPIEYFAYVSPAWAPDGQRIAYAIGDTVAILDIDAGTESVLRVDSIPAAPYLPGATPRNSAPAWSRDGARIAFVNTAANQVRGDGRIWEVDNRGGAARPVTSMNGLAPAWSPDGSRLAFFARDSADRWQLWTQTTNGGVKRLTNHDDLVTYRVRWMPDGRSLVYSADGGLWRLSAEGGAPTSIPFHARVTMPRRRAHLPAVTFPSPGDERTAKGFRSIALSSDGRLAMVALDSLWVGNVGSALRSLGSASGAGDNALTWSPDGREVAWTRRERPGQPFDLVVSDVRSGARRIIASLGQDVLIPTWSPDGRWIAFVAGNRLRLANPRADGVAGLEQTRDLGPAAPVALGTLAWSPRSDALLASWFDMGARRQLPEWIPLDGPRRTVAHFPLAVANLNLTGDGHAQWVERNQLWRASFDESSGLRGAPSLLSTDPAVEARYAPDGSILYLSSGGLRLRVPDGKVRAIGWPLQYRVAAAPEPILIRGARVIDGRGTPPSSPQDVLVREGKIERISAAGSQPAEGVRVIDARDAWLLPGFIDLHSHLWDDLTLLASLHNGVTAVRDIASQQLRTPDTRNMIEAGLVEGPRVVYGGAMFHRMGIGFSSLGDQTATDSGSIARALQILSGLDARFVKERGFEHWSSAVRLVTEAHRFGMTVSGHCEHILPVIAAGIDGAEHVLDCFRDRYPMRADLAGLARAANLWIVPTAALWFSMLHAMGDSALVDAPDVAPFLAPAWRPMYTASPGNQRNAPRFARSVQRTTRGVGLYHASGVTVATGTDSPFPLNLQHEMEVLVSAGFTPMEAITAATGTAARVLNAPRIGTIAEGQLADLVLLNANPLEDIRNTRQIRLVIQGGRIVDREGLSRKALR